MISYIQFASRINFFEFLQEEFYPPHFKSENYERELGILANGVSTDTLVRELENSPKIFDIAEEFFQLKRFTNTQYVHFLFDVAKLNNHELATLVRHADVTMFSFENGQRNELFHKLCKVDETNDINEKAMLLKRAVVEYVVAVLKNKKGREALYHHIASSIGTRFRIATYLIENLHADKHFSSTDLKNFLALKRIPRDGKGIHGKYGTFRIKKILNECLVASVNNVVTSREISLTARCVESTGWAYVTEKMISGVKKRKDGKLKKFDFVLLKDGVPAYCIETNFYSTTGTKIGINIGEYVDLREDISLLNGTQGSGLKFTWITDGNHWLSSDGEHSYKDLKARYFTEDWELLNYNLFLERLPSILNQ